MDAPRPSITPQNCWVSPTQFSIADVVRMEPRKGEREADGASKTTIRRPSDGPWRRWADGGPAGRAIALHQALYSRRRAILGWSVAGGFGADTEPRCESRLGSLGYSSMGIASCGTQIENDGPTADEGLSSYASGSTSIDQRGWSPWHCRRPSRHPPSRGPRPSRHGPKNPQSCGPSCGRLLDSGGEMPRFRSPPSFGRDSHVAGVDACCLLQQRSSTERLLPFGELDRVEHLKDP